MTVELRRAARNRQLQGVLALTVTLSVLSSTLGVSPLISTFLLPIAVWVSWGRDVLAGSLTQLVIGPAGRFRLLTCRFVILSAFVAVPLFWLGILGSTEDQTLRSWLVFSIEITVTAWLAITITRSITAALIPAAFAILCGSNSSLAEQLVRLDISAHCAIALVVTVATCGVLLRPDLFCGGACE